MRMPSSSMQRMGVHGRSMKCMSIQGKSIQSMSMQCRRIRSSNTQLGHIKNECAKPEHAGQYLQSSLMQRTAMWSRNLLSMIMRSMSHQGRLVNHEHAKQKHAKEERVKQDASKAWSYLVTVMLLVENFQERAVVVI